MSDKTYTIAILKAKDGSLEKMIGVLEQLANDTRKEPGALQYGFYQSQDDPNTVLSFEEWQDTDAETAHWKTPHLTAAIEAFKELLEGEPIIYKGPQII